MRGTQSICKIYPNEERGDILVAIDDKLVKFCPSVVKSSKIYYDCQNLSEKNSQNNNEI